MKIRPSKVVASIALAAFITSNSLFVYASDFTNSNKCQICSEHTTPKSIIKISKINDNSDDNDNFISIEVKTPYVFKTDKFENDNYSVLNLLNTTYSEYKQELKNGETLQDLIKRKQVTDSYNLIKYIEYEKILDNAVENNSLTSTEKIDLLNSFSATLI